LCNSEEFITIQVERIENNQEAKNGHKIDDHMEVKNIKKIDNYWEAEKGHIHFC
jgi:hypothetical protein